MNFFHNKIANPAGDAPTFNDWLEKQFGTKTASEAKPGIGMDMDGESRGQQRGQVINNDNEEGAHSYQEGESVDGKKEQGGNARPDKGGETDQKDNKQNDKGASTVAKVKQAKCGKEMGESSDAGKVTEDHTEAAPGDDEAKGDCSQLINNDPNYQKGESTDPGKVDGKNKKQPGDQVVGKSKSAASNVPFKKISSMNHKERLAAFAYFGSLKHPMDYVEAQVGLKFANLTAEEKKWLKSFWGILYPAEYVEEMVADR